MGTLPARQFVTSISPPSMDMRGVTQRSGITEDMLLPVLLEFARELASTRLELNRLVSRRDSVYEVYQLAQRVRGAALDLGIREVGNRSTELYVWLREHSTEDAPGHRVLTDPDGDYGRLVQQFQSCLGEYSRKIHRTLSTRPTEG